MADPYLSDDESVILATDRILFRSVTLPAVVLTNRRVLLLQTEGEDLSAEEILLSQLRTAEVDPHPGADPVLALIYRSAGGEPVQESLTFLVKDNKPRTEECRDWATKLTGLIAPPSGGGTVLRAPPIGEEPAAPPAGKPAPVSPLPAAGAGGAEPPAKESIPPPAPSAGEILAKHDRPADLAFPPLPKIPDAVLADSPPPAPRRRRIAVAAIVIIVIAVVVGAVFFTQVFQHKPAPSGAPAAPGPAVTTALPVTPATALPTETVPASPVPQALPMAANETPAPAAVSPATPRATPSTALSGSQVPIPATGVWVRVQDAGNFTGTVGAGAAVTPVSGTGERFYQLVTKTGTVQAIIQKVEGSGDLLAVDIYREGTRVGHGETRAPFGEVNLQFEIPAATPAPAAAANATGNS